jgi:hypothetical protein
MHWGEFLGAWRAPRFWVAPLRGGWWHWWYSHRHLAPGPAKAGGGGGASRRPASAPVGQVSGLGRRLLALKNLVKSENLLDLILSHGQEEAQAQ